MLHDWMGVKTGTVIVMMNSIMSLRRLYPDELSDDSFGFVEETPMGENHDDNIFQAGGHGNIQRVKPGIIKKKKLLLLNVNFILRFKIQLIFLMK